MTGQLQPPDVFCFVVFYFKLFILVTNIENADFDTKMVILNWFGKLRSGAHSCMAMISWGWEVFSPFRWIFPRASQSPPAIFYVTCLDSVIIWVYHLLFSLNSLFFSPCKCLGYEGKIICLKSWRMKLICTKPSCHMPFFFTLNIFIIKYFIKKTFKNKFALLIFLVLPFSIRAKVKS